MRKKTGVFLILLTALLFVVSGCAGPIKISNPALLKIDEMMKEGKYGEINNDIEANLIGCTEEEVVALLGEPFFKEPHYLEEGGKKTSEVWYYHFRPPKILEKKGFFWNKEMRVKKFLFIVGFDNGKVRAAEPTDPEGLEVQDGWLKAKVNSLKNPLSWPFLLAPFLL